MEIILTILVALLGLVVLGVFWAIASYNRLRSLQARCDHAKNDIDVQLKHRSDVFPNLAETVRSFVGQENRLLDMLRDVQMDINASTSVHNNTKSNANISNSFSNLFASLEQVPELRSSNHYVNLRNEILSIEERISASRRFLNLTTSEFSAARMKFPGSLFASKMGIAEIKGYSLGAERAFHEDAPSLNL